MKRTNYFIDALTKTTFGLGKSNDNIAKSKETKAKEANTGEKIDGEEEKEEEGEIEAKEEANEEKDLGKILYLVDLRTHIKICYSYFSRFLILSYRY